VLNDHCHRVTTQLQLINIIIIIIIIIKEIYAMVKKPTITDTIRLHGIQGMLVWACTENGRK
jgi:hypothetical protein